MLRSRRQGGRAARRPILVGLALLFALNAPLLAQDEADPARADSLRTVIQERFSRQVQQQLGLSPNEI